MAALLRDRGAKRGSVVGLCVDPGTDRIAGLLAIAKTGSTALLLDRADPTARLREILADARMTVLIGDAALETTLDWPRACALWLDADHAELDGAMIDRHRRWPTRADPDAAAIAFHAPGHGRQGAAVSRSRIGPSPEPWKGSPTRSACDAGQRDLRAMPCPPIPCR